MRAFIAIELPQEIKDTLAGLQTKLKAVGADVKWVEPKNIHLTLKFLGEIEEGILPGLNAKLEDIACRQPEFPASLFSCGAFPEVNSPRIIWAGIKPGDKELSSLAQAIDSQLEALGIPGEERKFSAHITLGRTRSSRNRKELAKAVSELGPESPKAGFRISRICLFKSTLLPRGPVYEIIKEFPLSTTSQVVPGLG